MNRISTCVLFAMVLTGCGSKKTETGSTTKQDSVSLETVSRADTTETDGPRSYGNVPPGSNIPSSFTFLGFSDDLQYAAFDVGWREGPDVNTVLYFINVDKNDYAAKPIKNSTVDEAQALVIENHNIAGAQFKKFKISGKNTGTLIALDSSKGSNRIAIKGKPYVLKLIQKPSGKAKMFELQIIHDGKVQILQKDTKVPKSRGIPTTYRLKAAYSLGNKIAVFISYDTEPTTDAENYWYYNTHQMIVTGAL